ncbi:hypothetical protein DM860_015279 [Cuscuta australis]|uniref:RING-type domain-containing protein n=1 Tax=Cuscuta australis TaxID=267555 RepID=A0A328D2W1_9ASTE|nr:hypothetical protein DM860_015279 [Cuscuta australis]
MSPRHIYDRARLLDSSLPEPVFLAHPWLSLSARLNHGRVYPQVDRVVVDKEIYTAHAERCRYNVGMSGLIRQMGNHPQGSTNEGHGLKDKGISRWVARFHTSMTIGAREGGGGMSEHEISSLKRGPFARAVEELCSICLDEFRHGSLVVITLPPPCDQVFYSRCIARWLHRKIAARIEEKEEIEKGKGKTIIDRFAGPNQGHKQSDMRPAQTNFATWLTLSSKKHP